MKAMEKEFRETESIT